MQQTDRLIATVPEVKRVFGKIGRAEKATDTAPLEMVESTVQLKPRSEWRAGMTPEKLVEELDRVVQFPGLANMWIPPIRNRIDMLATGIKSPLGIKVSGDDLAEIEKVAQAIEQVVKRVPGATSVLAERVSGVRYIDVTIDRAAAGCYGLNIVDVQSVISSAVGGETISDTIEGHRRFPISVRYPSQLRDSVEKLKTLPIVTEAGAQITLGTVAQIGISDGPPMLRSENARLAGWNYVDVRGRDLDSELNDSKKAVAREVTLPPGVSVAWSGQFEFLERRCS
ncbi:MAG: efflux RND transporter permease subunit [Betaproteobacteria bacterium]|nr:efflux RND transporter permease subunit [Betaproteobacteria bacterium]